jgi:hypothetical protein
LTYPKAPFSISAKILSLAGAVDAATNNDTFAELTVTDLATVFCGVTHSKGDLTWVNESGCQSPQRAISALVH